MSELTGLILFLLIIIPTILYAARRSGLSDLIERDLRSFKKHRQKIKDWENKHGK